MSIIGLFIPEHRNCRFLGCRSVVVVIGRRCSVVETLAELACTYRSIYILWSVEGARLVVLRHFVELGNIVGDDVLCLLSAEFRIAYATQLAPSLEAISVCRYSS